MNSLLFFVGLVSGDHLALAVLEIEEPEGLSLRSSPPLQPLLGDKRAGRAFVDGEVVGDETRIPALPVS